MDLNKRLKLCSTLVSLPFDHNRDDRLSNLPDELLIRILSLLPTKDAAAACTLCNRLRHVFPKITSLDIDTSPISFCLKHPYRIEQFPSFVTFVDAVLQAHQSQYLTRFKLGVGVGFDERRFGGCNTLKGRCAKNCYPYLTPTQIKSWITFPLTCCGLKELDLCIPVKEPGVNYQLPSEIFTCETLEVLKLDVDLCLDQAFLRFHQASTMSSIRLPNLKVLELHASLNLEDGFLPSLISNCPLLEDLTLEACCDRVNYIDISSPSLRRLCFYVIRNNYRGDFPNNPFVRFNTPNLEYLQYGDELALEYSISNMESLIIAKIHPDCLLRKVPIEVSQQQLLRLIRPLSHVQHLVLSGVSTELLDFVEVTDHLPMFQNLKHLELGIHNCWDKVLLALLKCSPVLETLTFPQGLVMPCFPPKSYHCQTLVLEREFCRIFQTIIPSCCRYYLKKIIVKQCLGNEREIDLIQFLLRHTLVLEELTVLRYPRLAVADRMVLESKLQNLPRASITCSIEVQDQIVKTY